MPRALVVDDETDIREFVGHVLRRAGFIVTEVQDGSEAQRTCGKQQFDLVVTDHHMPNVTGAELIEHLARVGHGAALILMSSDHSLSSHAVVRTGIATFLRKPFPRTSLVDAVRELNLGTGTSRPAPA